MGSVWAHLGPRWGEGVVGEEWVREVSLHILEFRKTICVWSGDPGSHLPRWGGRREGEGYGMSLWK